jgi:hypothetical protein
MLLFSSEKGLADDATTVINMTDEFPMGTDHFQFPSTVHRDVNATTYDYDFNGRAKL